MISNFTHGSLFSGIGGFDLAAKWLEWENVFQVEKDNYCLSILEKNFPKTHRYKDILSFDGSKYKNKITVLSGGFPCQPFSLAGNRKGRNDERYLWGEMLRVITEVKPLYVVAENVPGLLTNENGLAFKQVLTDLENANYKVQTFNIPAASKNAAHYRHRLWFIAHSTSQYDCGNIRETKKRQIQQFGNNIKQSNATNGNSERCKKQWEPIANETQYNSTELYWKNHWSKWGVEPTICGDNDGLPNRVDRIKALGNAVVPYVVFEIFNTIQLTHNLIFN
ncbi:MAG TPA: DNA (cytosine-5-)-methyltransferase [Saprospiraceae bacterium]|nr:DNA (cytosine-5-)-methyltransferase [Saprospiraceae bacterium]